MWLSKLELNTLWKAKDDRLKQVSLGNCYTRIQVNKWDDPNIIFDKPAECSKIYYNPVTLRRLRVSLRDDHGHLLDLNGKHWSVQIEAECIFLTTAEKRTLKKNI